MPKVIFLPSNEETEVPENTKILVAAIRSKTDIKYGCASCGCGTCGIAIEVSVDGELSKMEADEANLLAKMGLDHHSGKIRLACQTRIISGTATVDLNFQNTYSPDQNSED